MKILILLIIFLVSADCFAGKIVIAELSKDSDGNDIVDVTLFLENDGSSEKIRLKTESQISKLTPLIAKIVSGLTKDSDRVIFYLNNDNTINRVEHFVKTTTKDEVVQESIKYSDEIDSQYKADFETLKSEAIVK